MINYINHTIWYKVCRTIRARYKLSVNCLSVLIGMYVYSKFINHSFTRAQMLLFVTYFARPKMNSYFTVLLSHGYIMQSGIKLSHPLYSVSAIGLQVIKELNASYQLEFNKFIGRYNISL